MKTIAKQVFKINNKPFPWKKAVNAGICSGFPIILGLLLGQLSLGLLGGIGSFTYLYVFHEPYARRGKKLFFVAIGISLSVAIGTLVAPYPLLVAIIVGLIGATAVFIFGVLKISGPAAIFFVLSFVMTTGMPIDPSQALIRGGAVLISGIFAWIVGMSGWFFNPHGPEIKAVKEVYLALASFGEAIGNENIQNLQHRTMNTLKQSEEVLLTGYGPLNRTSLFNRLSLLNEQANKLFLEMLELHSKKDSPLPKDFGNMIRSISTGIGLQDGEKIKIAPLQEDLDGAHHKFLKIIYDIEKLLNAPLDTLPEKVKISKPSLKMKFTKSCDKDSILFINALRYGVILSLSALIAFSFPFAKPYWIPLSCAAVMSGSTVMSTFHRAIQRSCGTIVGIILATVILKLQPEGFLLVLIIMCLTAITELLIVKNYAIAAIFITPNALLIAETSTQIHNISYFVTARVTDVIVGSLIGLIGTYLISKRSASSRLPDFMVKLLRSQARAFARLASNQDETNNDNITWIKHKMNMNLMNFKIAYSTALDEIPNNKELLETMWPAFFSLEHLSYLIDQLCTTKGYMILPDEDLAQLLLVFESMATSIEQKQSVQPKKIPIMKNLPKVYEEINMLQDALTLKSIW